MYCWQAGGTHSTEMSLVNKLIYVIICNDFQFLDIPGIIPA